MDIKRWTKKMLKLLVLTVLQFCCQNLVSYVFISTFDKNQFDKDWIGRPQLLIP